MIIISGSSGSAAVNATDSVTAEASGMRPRGKDRLRMIERRSSTERSAFATLMITSWKGTTAQAIVRPGAVPPSLSSPTSIRYTPSAAIGSSSHLTARSEPRP